MSIFTAVAAFLASFACASPPDAPAEKGVQKDAPAPGVVHSTEGYPAEPMRVGGDMNVKVEPRGEFWQSGKVITDEHLPAGYPRPTPPGAIEIKHYPSVRRAEVTMKSEPGRGRDFAFWPLFNHISKRGIAMTSPVEMDFDAKLAAAAEGVQGDTPEKSWQMSFLYRTPELGDTGKAGVVNVVDKPAVTVLSLGLMGDYWPADLAKKVEMLETWIKDHPEWKATGAARIMAYNGPNIATSRRWGELQIPIVPSAQAAAPADASPAASK